MTNVSRRRFLELAGVGAAVGAGVPSLGAGPQSDVHAAVANTDDSTRQADRRRTRLDSRPVLTALAACD